jgi:hypothetical protein
MSAYVVDDITINRILGYLEYGKHAPHYIRKRLLTTVNQSYEELGKAMYRLNCQSVDERYGEKAEDMHGDEYVYRLDVSAGTIQAYKSLQCYLYQSCEGNCDKELLYKMLDEFKNYLGESIIADMPEYSKAEWA